MYRGLFIVIILFLSCCITKGQSSHLDCNRLTGGVFVKGSFADSVIVYRGLEYWIEADLKEHECRVYKILWTDACNFVLIPNNRIDENKNNKLRKALADSLFCTSESSDTLGVTYGIKRHLQDARYNPVTLYQLKDTLAWEYLIYADSNLYFDTAEISLLYGTPKQAYYFNIPSFINLETDSADTRFANYVVSLFITGDIKPAFNFASVMLKTHSPESILEDYTQYVEHLFGKLKSYEVASIREGYKVSKSSFSHSYVIKGNFEKLSEGASICMSTSPGKKSPLLSLSVAADSANSIPFLKDLTHTFWEQLKHKKNRKIYDSSSALFKESQTYKQALTTLNHIDSLGHLDGYKIYFQNYSVVNNKGMILVSFKCILPDKTLLVNLFYTFENGEYKLAAVDAPKN